MTCTQHRTLVFLEKAGGKSTQKEIETYLEVSHPTVVGILSGLESKGLVQCRLDSDDKRVKRVFLSEEGRKLLQNSLNDAVEMGNVFWKDISDEELEILIVILEKLKENLNSD